MRSSATRRAAGTMPIPRNSAGARALRRVAIGTHAVDFPSDGTSRTGGGMSVGGALKIGMVAYGDVTHDSRVQREASSLAAAGHDVTLFALSGPGVRPATLDSRVRLEITPPTRGAVVPGSPSPFRSASHRGRVGRAVEQVGWSVGYARGLRAWGRIVVAPWSDINVWVGPGFAGLIAISGAI